jgi:hypothetical protein
MNEYQEVIKGLENHLILSGLTFNAEHPSDPVVLRPMKVEILLSTVLEFLRGAGYVNTTKIS